MYISPLETLSSIIRNAELRTEKKQLLRSDVQKIRHRIKDTNLYLGIVGEFSSGKSTFINSIIGEDFFVTNVLQGTTTVVTKLQYAKSFNMRLMYKSGKTLTYKRDKAKIMCKYFPKEYKQLSHSNRINIILKGIFHLNHYDDFFLKAFDYVTTNNEISSFLNEVILYYPSDILKKGLVIVDTPGIDSLSEEHKKMTQKAIKEICDIALVMIPATQPLSEALSSFIQENLIEECHKCKFLITKIELINSEVERSNLEEWVERRIKDYFYIDEPVIIHAPTLLSLEVRNIIKRTNILNHINEDDKYSLINKFDADIEKMMHEIMENRAMTIKSKNRFSRC